jgi:hypothetical protein
MQTDTVGGIEVFRKLISITPVGEKTDRASFDQHLKCFPRAVRDGYCGGHYYKHEVAGKDRVVATLMDNGDCYIVRGN